MGKELKSFFAKQPIGQITSLDMKVASVDEDDFLIKRILDLNPESEALELTYEIIPNSSIPQGTYWSYNHPSTVKNALNSRKLPWRLREIAIDNLKKNPKKSKRIIGLSSRPIQSVDEIVRLFPFSEMFEGAKLYAYSVREKNLGRSEGIIVDDTYDNAPQVVETGATIHFQVPSRVKGSSPDKFALSSIPVVDNARKRIIVWNINYGGITGDFGEAIKGETTIQRFERTKYRTVDRRNTSRQIIFYPHHIAAYIAFAKQQAKRGNNVPLEMNPFTWPSKLGAEIYDKCHNNLIVNSEGKRRHLRREEVSNIIARTATELTANEVLYNDVKRDPKISKLW